MLHLKSRFGFFGFAAVLVIAAAFLSPHSSFSQETPAVTPSAPPAESKADADVTGIYRSDSGAEARLYQPADSAQWVMTYTKPDETPMTIYMDGQPSALTPVGLDAAVTFNGSPMTLTAEGGRVYAKGMSGGKSIECLTGDELGTRAALDGKPTAGGSTPDEMEASMMIQDYAAKWELMKAARVEVAGGNLTIHSAGGESTATTLNRQSGLSESDMDTLGRITTSRANGLAGAKAFSARERKLEDTP